jgi:hypothetical protein
MGLILLIGVIFWAVVAILIYTGRADKKRAEEEKKDSLPKYLPKKEEHSEERLEADVHRNAYSVQKTQTQSGKKRGRVSPAKRHSRSADVWLPEEHIKRLLLIIVPTFISEVKKRYPLIPFDFPDVDT